MRINALFYGGCQVGGILQMLNLSDDYNASWIGCKITDLGKESFTKIVSECDIIITHSIDDNFRSVDYLSTSYIIRHKKPECKVIIIDVCRFNFYYFDAFHDYLFRTPTPYHYRKMVECFKQGHSVEYYINNFVNNIELKTSDELELIAEDSLKELYKRYKKSKVLYEQDNVYIITLHDYIKQNYKNKLLFYSTNHPTKHVFQNICDRIINILQIPNTINYSIDPLFLPKCIIYKCISKNVTFEINNLYPQIGEFSDVTKVTQLYYDAYTESVLLEKCLPVRP